MDKTIIILTPGFPADENDTTAVPYLQDYVNALVRRVGSSEVKIITVHYPFTKKTYYWNKVEVIPLNGRNKRGLSRLFIQSRGDSALKKITQTWQCVVHSFWLTDATVIASMRIKIENLRGRKDPFTHIATMMGQDVLPTNKMLPYINPDKTELIALSNNQAKIFENANGITVKRIIPFGIEKVKLNGDEIRTIDILFVGSLIELKQPQLFVELFYKLSKDIPNLKGAMIGNGPLKKRLEANIAELGIGDNLKIWGELPRQQVFEQMKKSRILMHTSAFEGQCLAYTEALAHGMYVVSFDTGNIEKTEKHIVCPTAEDMHIQVFKLLQSNLDHSSFQPYTIDDTVSRYFELYEADEN